MAELSFPCLFPIILDTVLIKNLLVETSRRYCWELYHEFSEVWYKMQEICNPTLMEYLIICAIIGPENCINIEKYILSHFKEEKKNV